QTVIVNKRSVVAVEAMEGTDATLLRAGSLCKGGTVAKMMRLDQDERYDIPTVGPDTLRHMAQAKLNCLALHAGWTLILEPEEFQAVAKKENISVIGVEVCRSL
ncbi:LpxI family protein, partial [Cloacibacillus porcorum]